MKMVGDFKTKDAELGRQLDAFQSNVAAAVSALERDCVVEPQIIKATLNGSLVRPGQLCRVDSGASIELLLVQPRPDDETLTVVIVKEAAAGTVTLRGINCFINGAATAALAAVGRYELQVAGGQYWR